MKFLGLEISKKLLIGIIVGVVAVGGATTGVILMNNNKDNQKQEEKQKDTILLKDDLKFEINSEVNLLSLVSEDNKVKVLSDDETIDTSTLGDKEITIKYEVEEQEEEKTFKITIVDTQAPTIEYQKELSTNVGTKIDLLKNVKVSDNSKEEIKATIDGDYNFDNEGTYNLKYVAVDSSNNKTEEEFTLKVNKKPTTSSNKPNNSNNKPQTNNNSNNNNSNNNNSNNNNSNNTSTNNCVSGKWSTSKPSGCEYTTKTITWLWQLNEDMNGNSKWVWTIAVEYVGVGIGFALPSQVDSSYEEYKYLSTQPKETYNDNQEHEKYITVYIIK